MNRLQHETSPYLRQHMHNPVDWYPWGEEALNKAKNENKPVLVSIGYAACHWCHVMERESFEDPDTAGIMNRDFINIKIDREERPDLDHIYMDAVQAMTGSGGWPLNVFLTPEGKPFYGGTYFPPKPAFNRASWKDVLDGVSKAFREKRHEIDAQAENLTEHLLKSNSFGMQPGSEKLQEEFADTVYENLKKSFDAEWGGFGKAPKFPQTFSIQYILRYAWEKGKGDDEKIKSIAAPALFSLDKMINGGIYDQLGGGFARYSTDVEWLAPHFEKMLYDNALLIMVLSEAYQITGKERYREVIEETIGFIERELKHPEGGFYSALDADSEGVEGKFYVWSNDEVDTLLGSDAALFREYYDVSEKGNWEHTNILRVLKDEVIFAKDKNIDVAVLREVLKRGRKKLMSVRDKRVRPQLDDKILLGWNALMNIACSRAYAATSVERYRELAIKNMGFMESRFCKEGRWYHTWKDEARYPAFADDLAFLVKAMIHLQEITGNLQWLGKAREITETIIDDFSDEEKNYFFYTPSWQTDVIIRKKEVYDGAVPSANSVMAGNLWHLGILFDENEWKERSVSMVSSLAGVTGRYPTSFGNWASVMIEIIFGTNEIAIVGNDADSFRTQILNEYVPHRVLMSTAVGDDRYPLLAGKTGGQKTNVYLCRDYTCKNPVGDVKALRTLINSRNGQ